MGIHTVICVSSPLFSFQAFRLCISLLHRPPIERFSLLTIIQAKACSEPFYSSHPTPTLYYVDAPLSYTPHVLTTSKYFEPLYHSLFLTPSQRLPSLLPLYLTLSLRISTLHRHNMEPVPLLHPHTLSLCSIRHCGHHQPFIQLPLHITNHFTLIKTCFESTKGHHSPSHCHINTGITVCCTTTV